ncbi:MAG: alpha/beta hydrolase [Alphaproteobacteria bacterium]|nr:alpha/beta hydrolase [Alphaproteobacteria bacterium]
MTLLKWLLVGCAFYGALVALMYVAQRSLMYLPERQRVAPAHAGMPEAEEVVLDTADGERVIVWHVPPRDGFPVVLYFHGNGGSLRYRVGRFRALTDGGIGLVALSYRGYGGSSGSPSETGLIADGEAVYRFATQRYAPDRIALWGESLGSGVAVAIAAANPVARIVLESPFTSAADVGARVYWFLPVRLLIKDPFRSDLRIAKVKAPLLILHGERDAVVPYALGERLFGLANEPKRLVRYADGNHNDLDRFGALAEARAFVALKAD